MRRSGLHYEVASQSEARAALDSVAKISPASADLLKQASDKLTKDWSPPSQPDGLILLRRIPTQSSTPKDTGTAITPSQMKRMLMGWIEIEVVDQDNDPYPTHYWLELASSDVREGALDENACLNISEIEPGMCKLTVGEVRLAADTGEPTEEPVANGEDEPAKAATSDAGQEAWIPDEDSDLSESFNFDDASNELEDEPVDWDDEDEESS